MNLLRRAIPLLVGATLLGGCGKSGDSAPAAPSATPANPAAAPFLKPSDAAVTPPAVAAEKASGREVYRCGDGRHLVLKHYDDQRVRVEIDHETQVLRPVATGEGRLLVGDFVNVRVVGDKATASRNGIVLMSNCQLQAAP